MYLDNCILLARLSLLVGDRPDRVLGGFSPIEKEKSIRKCTYHDQARTVLRTSVYGFLLVLQATRLMETPELVATLGREAYRRASDRRWTHVARETYEFFKESIVYRNPVMIHG